MRRLALATALCACLLTGCGGGDGDDKGGRTQTVPAGKAVRVIAREYSFDPQNVVITGGGRVKLALANKGSLAHNLKVRQGDRELGGTPTFQSGRTESGTVELDTGSYTMVCTVGNHAELGMRGKLEVER